MVLSVLSNQIKWFLSSTYCGMVYILSEQLWNGREDGVHCSHLSSSWISIYTNFSVLSHCPSACVCFPLFQHCSVHLALVPHLHPKHHHCYNIKHTVNLYFRVRPHRVTVPDHRRATYVKVNVRSHGWISVARVTTRLWLQSHTFS